MKLFFFIQDNKEREEYASIGQSECGNFNVPKKVKK